LIAAAPPSINSSALRNGLMTTVETYIRIPLIETEIWNLPAERSRELA
jgi:hypothetical protein